MSGMMTSNDFTFIDLFSGIGGFHIGMAANGGKCVLACDIDPVASESYQVNFKILPKRDVKDLLSEDIPDFDVLCAGFPCQPFSNIGQKKAFEDSRGDLIFEVVRILKDKQPRAFILENVKGLKNIQNGKVLSIILEELKESGYDVWHDILEAKDYGVPQIRKRLFIVGIRKDLNISFKFPDPIPCESNMSKIMKGNVDKEFGYTVRVGGRHSGINNKFNWDCYMVDGNPRYVTAEECLQLQGFPSDHYLAGNKSEKFRQVGNAVPTTVVREVCSALKKTGVFSQPL